MVSLLVVDRSQFMAETMLEVLKTQPDLNLVGVTADVDEALRNLGRCNRLVISAALPNQEALQLIARVRRVDSDIKIIVMDLCKESKEASAYLQAGAAVCVYEDDTIADLLRTARA